MSDSISPALTPEEWRHRLVARPGCPVVHVDTGPFASISLCLAPAGSNVAWGVEAEGLPALVALANEAARLTEGPYAFTHEDVYALEAVYRHIISDLRPDLPSAAVERMHDLAARIAALLPPDRRPSPAGVAVSPAGPLDLDAIVARATASTADPLEARVRWGTGDGGRALTLYRHRGTYDTGWDGGWEPIAKAHTEEDATFYVHARADVLALAEEVGRLRALLGGGLP